MTSLKTLAISTALSGNWERAIDINKSLVKEDPSDIDALNRLAFALTIIGKLKDARLTYQKVLKIDGLNSLALRNLKKLDRKSNPGNVSPNGLAVNNTFIEEQGKTKIIELVNIAQPTAINTLRTGQILMLSVKRLKIFVSTDEGKYIGVLPDNIGKRLIKFIKAGNEYKAYVKSAFDHHLIVFLKETKRVSRLRDQPSFLAISESTLEFSKKPGRPLIEEDQEEEREE